ncbi:MAG: hypothetical protein Q9169_003842 [Polycauliona sp. 2 TL-2023]
MAKARTNDVTTAEIVESFKVDLKEVTRGDILMGHLPIPFVLGLSIANVTAWNTRTAGVAALWSAALQAAPAVREAMFSNVTLNLQQQPLYATRPVLSDKDSTGGLLTDGLRLIMSNITTFLDFTSEGRFTDDGYPYIPIDGDFDIATGVQTFVLSRLMQSDTYYAVPLNIVERAEYESISAANKNNYYYWSPSTHRMYELFNKGGAAIDTWILGDHIMNDGWGDAQLLFDGSYNCTAAGNAGAAIVNEKPNDGGIDVSCVSQLPMVSQKRLSLDSNR